MEFSVYGEGNSITGIISICGFVENVDTKYKIQNISKYVLRQTKYYEYDVREDILAAVQRMFKKF